MKPKGPYTINADTFKSLSRLKTFMVDVDIVFVVNVEDIQKLFKVSNCELIEFENRMPKPLFILTFFLFSSYCAT